MQVSLREITAETVRRITSLSVNPDQQRFVASNAVSLAEALFSEEAWYRAVYVGESPAGFVMLYDESLRATSRKANTSRCTVVCPALTTATASASCPRTGRSTSGEWALPM